MRGRSIMTVLCGTALRGGVWHRTSLGRNLLRNMLIYTQSYLSEASDNMIYTEEEPWKQAGFLLMRTT